MKAKVIKQNKMKREEFPPIKITLNKKDIIKILVYSANIINANPPLLYSVLYPDTNSDSPSAKSNGVRLVSARQEMNQTNLAIGKIKINQKSSWKVANPPHS